MKRFIIAALLVLAAPDLSGAQPPPVPRPASPRGVEVRADQELRRMSEFLAKLPRFALEAEEIFDELVPGEPRRQLTNLRRVAVERPDRLAADATGDTLSRAAWYDGKSLSTLDKEHNTYATVDAPATVDGMLDMLEETYGVVLPLADFVSGDPYTVLGAGLTYGRYLGVHLAADVPCHHLVFAQDTIEWQLWIDAGEQPLPRKFVITYVLEEGEPQYSATFRRWSVDPKFPDGLFSFVAPEGAQRVEPQKQAALQGGAAASPRAAEGGR